MREEGEGEGMDALKNKFKTTVVEFEPRLNTRWGHRSRESLKPSRRSPSGSHGVQLIWTCEVVLVSR